jgi:hypothetical protein
MDNLEKPTSKSRAEAFATMLKSITMAQRAKAGQACAGRRTNFRNLSLS